MKTYLKSTPFHTFKDIRRVPKQLLEIIDISTFRVSLGSNELEATLKAVEFNSAIENAIKLFQRGLPKETIIEKLNDGS